MGQGLQFLWKGNIIGEQNKAVVSDEKLKAVVQKGNASEIPQLREQEIRLVGVRGQKTKSRSSVIQVA